MNFNAGTIGIASGFFRIWNHYIIFTRIQSLPSAMLSCGVDISVSLRQLVTILPLSVGVRCREWHNLRLARMPTSLRKCLHICRLPYVHRDIPKTKYNFPCSLHLLQDYRPRRNDNRELLPASVGIRNDRQTLEYSMIGQAQRSWVQLQGGIYH